MKNDLRGVLGTLLFPPRCLSCGERLVLRDLTEVPEPLCPSCRTGLMTQKREKCPECGKPHPECHCRFDPRFPAAHLFCYDPGVPGTCGRVLYRLKKKPLPRGTSFPADELARLVRARGWDGEDAVLTFVPRSPRRKRQQGVDQAEELCRLIAAETGLPFVPVLLRSDQGTEEQQKHLTAAARKKRAAQLYRVDPRREADVGGKRVVLIDDLVTTGSTAVGCGELLLAAGAKSVCVLSFGITGKDRDSQ